MRRSLLTMLALLPAGLALVPAISDAARPNPFPRGEVVFRPECLGAEDLDSVLRQAPGGVLGGSTTGASNRQAAPPPPPTKKPAAPTTTESQSIASKLKDALGWGSMSKEPASAPDSTPMDAGAADWADGDDGPGFMSAPEEEAEPAPEPVADAPTPTPQKKAKERRLDDKTEGDSLSTFEERERRTPRTEAEKSQRALDWGATVYLSNDDSMSLASAQRALYAVMNGLGLSPHEIRPHELLNYFSFDTVTPDGDQMFDVLASAEQHGETLSVALAVKGAEAERQPLDLTLIVDVSCSMQADGRMAYTQRGLTLMSDQLSDGDRVDLVMFDDRACVPLQNWVAGRDDPALLQRAIAGLEPDGSTDMDLGLREGYRVAKAHLDTQGRNRRVMLLTDALLNTGDVNHDTVSEIGAAFDGDDIRLTGVGVGREFNDDVLDMLTEKGKGAYVYLGSEAVVDRVFGTGFDSLVQTIAHDVHFALRLPDSLAMERFYGEEASTTKADIQPLNYYSGTSQLFLQDLVIKGDSPRRGDAVELEITYRDARTGEPETRVFRTTVGKMLDTDRHNVRKGLALMAWTDMLTTEAMGGDGCGRDLDVYAGRAAKLGGDAEIGFVNGLIRQRCGDFDLPTFVSDAPRVEYKVRVDADIPIAEVALACDGQHWSESLSGSDTIARFDAVPGQCDLTLSGTVDMTARVEVPNTGGNTRCIVRGGRLSCS